MAGRGEKKLALNPTFRVLYEPSRFSKTFLFSPQKEKKRALDLPFSRAFARRRSLRFQQYSETDDDPV